MNREIKFRAWDKKTNSWYDDSNQYLVISLDGTLTNCWNGELMEDYTDRIILLPFTGLNDKNDVEIYEGYIIEELWLSPVSGEIYPLRMAVFRDITGAWRVKYPNGTLGNVHLLRKRIEVIGNLYENTELLEVES